MQALSLYSPVPYRPWESYGLIALQLVQHLRALGVHVTPYGPDRDPPIYSSGGIVLGPPESFASQGVEFHKGAHVAVTMFESSRIPSWWLEPLNACAAVIVPSWFCLDAFRQSGVTVPIYVIPLGVDACYGYRQREKRPSPLTFLAFLDRGERKGGLVALQAFLRAFGDDSNYRLILKSRAKAAAGQIGFSFSNPNIDVIQADFDEQELVALYERADVLISAHKGEGFGMLPREFAATGGLALATDWSGTADGLEQWGHPLPYRLVPAVWSQNKAFANQDLGEWAELDPAEVAKVLRYIASDFANLRIELPRKAAAVRALYSWRAFAEGVLQIWQGVSIGNTTRLPVAAA